MSWKHFLVVGWATMFAIPVTWDPVVAPVLGKIWPVMASSTTIEAIDLTPADGRGAQWRIYGEKLRSDCDWKSTRVWYGQRKFFPTNQIQSQHRSRPMQRGAGKYVWSDFRIDVPPQLSPDIIIYHTYWNTMHRCYLGPIGYNVRSAFYDPPKVTP